MIRFSDAVQPICLPYKPSADENYRKNLAVDIIGWSWEEEKIEEFNTLGKSKHTLEYEQHDFSHYDFLDYYDDSEEIQNNLFQSDLQHVHLKVFAKEKCNQYIGSVGIKMKSTLTCAGRDVRFFLPFYCRGPFKYYVIMFLTFLGPPTSLMIYITVNHQKLPFSDPTHPLL